MFCSLFIIKWTTIANYGWQAKKFANGNAANCDLTLSPLFCTNTNVVRLTMSRKKLVVHVLFF